jgi:mono/diheme cytochrome c family protein
MTFGWAVLLITACADEEPGRSRQEAVAPADPVQVTDPSGRFALAGISATLDLDIEPVQKSELSGDTLGRTFHIFMARCGACHQVPAPGGKPAAEWKAVVERMRMNAAAAGLMPSSSEDEAVVLDYLERHGG